MKKIGIITHYYNSHNYGGLLQAYALCRILDEYGYDAEQISYDTSVSISLQKKASSKGANTVKSKIRGLLSSFYHRQMDRKILSGILKRNAIIAEFAETIPHSKITYTDATISECNDIYDVFITGSDQVWNLMWYYPAYFLDFVKPNKPKISYAASISQKKLTDDEILIIKSHLTDYTAVSVREENAVDLLTKCTSLPVEWTLDPTLLLSDKQWDVVSAERIIKDKYLFCYFLGDSTIARNLAKEYAKKHNLVLATIPYLSNHYRKCDKKFGDIQLYNVNPQMFISLIKYAEIIFTDSFHATVFSNIYKQQYYVFERSNFASMNSRIESLIRLFESSDRFCNSEDRQKLSYLESLSSIDYSIERPLFEQMKRKSLDFLLNNIK